MFWGPTSVILSGVLVMKLPLIHTFLILEPILVDFFYQNQISEGLTPMCYVYVACDLRILHSKSLHSILLMEKRSTREALRLCGWEKATADGRDLEATVVHREASTCTETIEEAITTEVSQGDYRVTTCLIKSFRFLCLLHIIQLLKVVSFL